MAKLLLQTDNDGRGTVAAMAQEVDNIVAESKSLPPHQTIF